MKQKFRHKKEASKYRKTVIDCFIRACIPAIAFTGQSAIYKYKSLKMGEYPEEPVEIINARLHAMRLIIVREAVIWFLLLTLIFFTIYLIYWFKRNHDINLIQELKNVIFKKKKQSDP